MPAPVPGRGKTRPGHDRSSCRARQPPPRAPRPPPQAHRPPPQARQPQSEEHTSELQSRGHLVCRLLLEKKKKKNIHHLSICTRNDPTQSVASREAKDQ